MIVSKFRISVFLSRPAPYFFLNPILAGNYVGAETGPIEDITNADINFSGEDFEVFAPSDVNITGKVGSRIVAKGEEEFEVSTINLIGKGIFLVEEE